MRDWLLDHLDSEELPGLTWVDRQSGIFKIRWRHGSRHGWSKKDIDVFEQWAKHTGRHYYGNERDEKRWKANFRCALNSLKTVKPVSKTLKGQNAFREYRIMDMLDKEPDVKPTSQATATRPKRKIKKEAATNEEEIGEEIYVKSATAEDVTSQGQSREETTEAVVKVPVSVPNITINLPNFNQISPGLLPLFEYGKQHTIKNHYCGYTVTQLGGDQQSSNMISYRLNHQTSVDGNPKSVDSNPYQFPETPEDSLPTDTEQGDIDMDADCIEITIGQETEGPWDNNSSGSYSDHFPLTPPEEVVISQEQTANGNWMNQRRVSVDMLPTFVSDCNFRIDF